MSTDLLLPADLKLRQALLSMKAYVDALALGGGGGVSDHGLLTGLADDDHAQYHNDTRGDARYLTKSLNLSDVVNPATARTNLGLGTAATTASSAYDVTGAAAAAQAASQPLDTDLTAIAALTSAADKVPYATGAGLWALATFTAAGRALTGAADAAAQRTALGLGTAATTAATAYATAAQGTTADAALKPANNLSDVAVAATARTNLGLGTAATTAATAYATAAQGTTADAAIPKATVGAKGTLVTGTAASTPSGLAVGTDGFVLLADSTAATGLKWGALGGGGDMLKANNLSDLLSAATARTNLGLGAVALLASVAKSNLSTAAGELGAAWTTYTPTDSGITVGNGTRTAAYLQVGKTVWFRWQLVAGTTSSLNVTSNAVGLPVASKASAYQSLPAYYLDSTVRHWVGVAIIQNGTTVATLVNTESGAFGLTASGSPSAAWFGSGDVISVSGCYEAA